MPQPNPSNPVTVCAALADAAESAALAEAAADTLVRAVRLALGGNTKMSPLSVLTTCAPVIKASSIACFGQVTTASPHGGGSSPRSDAIRSCRWYTSRRSSGPRSCKCRLVSATVCTSAA